MSSTMGGSNVRHNFATFSFDCVDDQTLSTRVSQDGFPTNVDKRDSTSVTQESVSEESKRKYRHLDKSDRDHESKKSIFISENNADKSTQTRCDNSDNVSDVGKFSQFDTASFNTTCNDESNTDSYRKYPKRQTQLFSRYADFELGQQDRKRSKNNQTVTNKSLSKTDQTHRSNSMFQTDTPLERDLGERRIY